MIRGTTRPVCDRRGIRENARASIHNKFLVEVVDSATGKVKAKAVAENTLCGNLWGYLCSSGAWSNYVHYGTGHGTPSTSDTSLFSFSGYAPLSFHGHNFDYERNVYQITKKATVSESAAIGITITEIGIGQSTSASSLLTHAMLKDMNGNPISLYKTDTDVLNIYATVFCHFILPNGCCMLGYSKNSSGEVVTEGVLSHIGGHGKMGGVYFRYGKSHAIDIGAGAYAATISYDVNARTITFSLPRRAVGDWNFGGIKTLCIGSYPEFGFDVSEDNDWYDKTVIIGESIGTGDGVTTDYSTAFTFAKNATVYVDGVAVESTVEYGYNVSNLGHYMRMLRADRQGCYVGSYGSITGPLYGYDSQSDIFRIRGMSGTVVLENVLWRTHPVNKITVADGTNNVNVSIQASNDLENWADVASGETLTDEYRYWKLVRATQGQSWVTFSCGVPLPSPKNIHLAVPPAEGAVITADYDAICIGKDANHVFDFSVTFQFNEYTEAQ